MKIAYKSLALRDLEEKRAYLTDTLKNPAAAQKLMTAILQAVSLLVDAPRMGTPLRSKLEVDTDLRYLVVSKQLVFYRIVDDEHISVIRILDGRQDYMTVLFEEF